MDSKIDILWRCTACGNKYTAYPENSNGICGHCGAGKVIKTDIKARNNEFGDLEYISQDAYPQKTTIYKKEKMRKYKIKLICIACNGSGWNWGTSDEHAQIKNYVGGTDRISCIHCNGTGKYETIIEEIQDTGEKIDYEKG